MKKQLCMWIGLLVGLCCSAPARAYLIQGVELTIDYWAGSGANESVIVIDWNQTNGPYKTEFHCFGFRWDAPQTTVKDALTALEATGPLSVIYAYGGGFIGDMIYDQTSVDGDYHTAGTDFFGWWWTGHTDDGGLTWTGNSDGVDKKQLRHGRIEGFNLDGANWTSDSLTIPEPTSMVLLASGAVVFSRSRKRKQRTLNE